jgi:hypothetical protein
LQIRAQAELERRRRSGESIGALAHFQDKYRHKPHEFARDCLLWPAGDGPTGYQMEVLEAIPAERRVTVRGPHGLGKTSLAAWAILWFALTRDGQDWKAPTTASAWRQLTKYLWPEVHKWSRRLNWERIGREPFDYRRELLTLSLRLQSGEAFALATADPNSIEGAHATNLFYVFDEAKAIGDPLWDAAEGAFAAPEAGEVYALAISTPGAPLGRFYDLHARKPGFEDWWVRHVKVEEAIAAGRIGPEWVEQRRRQWGESSAIYQNRVAGEFAAEEQNSVIPLALIERSNDRWREWDEGGRELQVQLDAIGVDVARSGSDRTVLAFRSGPITTQLEDYVKADTMETAGRVAAALRNGGVAVVDVVGIGAGVVDRLREDGLPVIAFNAGARSELFDRSGEWGFADCRAAAWWNLRERLEADEIALPPDDRLTGDLVAPTWQAVSGGKIRVESKEKIVGRLGRLASGGTSTDYGDAVVMAFWEEPLLWGLI